MRRMKKIALTIAVVALGATALTACEETSRERETEVQSTSYDELVANQPAVPMTYSSTRATVNQWAETWSEPGKLAFTYFLNADGEAWGYYVLQGLPVSYCAMLTPSYRWEKGPVAGSDYQPVPAPGIDGAYYSGGQCDTYFGIDATTGTLVEWTAGMGNTTVTYEEPQGFPGARALGPTEEDDVG